MYYRPPSENQISLNDALSTLIKDLKLKPRMDELKIRQLWNELMGKAISNHTKSLNLKGNKLYINVDSAALKQELYYSRSKIKELLNKEMNENIIHEVLVY